MSVINKMLRDLDRRRKSSKKLNSESADWLNLSTVSFDDEATVVAPVPLTERQMPWFWIVLLLGIVAAAGLGWYSSLHAPAKLPPQPLPSPPVAVVKPNVPAVAPPQMKPSTLAPVTLAKTAIEPPTAGNPVAPAPVMPQVVAASRVAAMELRMDSGLNLRRVQESDRASKLAVPVPVPAAPEKTSATGTSQASVPTPVPQATPSVAPAALLPASRGTTDSSGYNAQRQQFAAKEAIAHAQNLWAAGSRDAAIDLLQEALAVAERGLADGAGGKVQALGLLVRELASMQLAESRPGPVLELLVRLEPVFAGQPEIWALRANAAQRLGRHQDSVHAYMIALQSRPGEQRWLLGAAVSLAALGQTASASELTEKARAAGPISKEVQAYLRQMGVAVKD